MKLSQIISDRVEVTVPFPGGEVKAVYNPQVLTPRFWDTELTFAQRIVRAVPEWDVETEAGAVPLTEEALSDLPDEFIVKFWLGLLDERRGNVTGTSEKNASSSSSP